jgi:type I restriction enzyme M protein
MSDVRTTEREAAGEINNWLNALMEGGGYPFERTTVEPLLAKGAVVRYPDIQIWLNRHAEVGFCGLELKPPDVAADDPELVRQAADKAARMNADYFVTWNLRDTVIWRRPEGDEVSAGDRVKTYPSIYQVADLRDVWTQYPGALLRDRARDLLNDLATLHREGHLHLVETDTTFFVGRLRRAVERVAPVMQTALQEKVGGDRDFRARLNDWAVKQGIPNFGDDAFYQSVSRQIVYRMIGRIILYETLMRYSIGLPKMELREQRPGSVSERLREYFEEARRIDWQAVFESDITDSVPLQESAAGELASLVDDLHRFSFSSMPVDVIGRVFEQLIPDEERRALGQYFTREDLVDLIVAFCVRGRNDLVLDPTCGSGTFLVRAYDRLRFFGAREHRQLLSQLWGVDIAHFPAELATINLYRQDVSHYENFPRVAALDFFDVRPGQMFEFPPPKLAEGRERVQERLPAFDAAIGNFPYVRQEAIERRIKGYKAQLKQTVAEDWLVEYPDGFEMPKSIWIQFERAREEGLDLSSYFARADLRLSGQADIYAYMFFHTARHVGDGGRMGFVTSNAWLDVAYGCELQRFFLNNFRIVAVLESRCEPWFEDPSVNTVVTILERCTDRDLRADHVVKFVKVKRTLRDLIPWDMRVESMRRWAGIDGLVRKIGSSASVEGRQQRGEQPIPLPCPVTFEDEDVRIRGVAQRALQAELDAEGKTAKWGRYLRAPDVYFRLLNNASDKLVRLGGDHGRQKLADIRRGVTTGINQFFHVTPEVARHWGIEEEFLVPIVTSLKEIDKPVIDPEVLKYRLFKCQMSKEELRKSGRMGALRYIEHGESQRTSGRGRVGRAGVPYPDVPSVRSRERWFDVGDRESGHMVVNRFVGERFFFPVNNKGVLASDTFFEIRFRDASSASMYEALVNTTLVYLFAELTGRITWTQGVLYLYGPEISALLVPDPGCIPPDAQRRIVRAFDRLLERPIYPISREVQLGDRRELDGLVLEALGLDPNQYLSSVYDGLVELVSERMQLSARQRKIRSARRARDVRKLRSQVIDEVLPEGLRRFPGAFVDASVRRPDLDEVFVPAEPLKLGEYFMGRQQVVSDSGFEYEANTVDAAKYIIYAQSRGSHLARVPRSDVAVTKAVTDYERYLREVRERLFKAFFERTQEHALADRLTNSVLEDLGVPTAVLG